MGLRLPVRAYQPRERIGMRASSYLPSWPGIRSSGALGRREEAALRAPGLDWRGYHFWLTLAITLAVGGFCALVQGPTWNQDASLAGVNLTASMLFVFTGLMLRREPGQRAVGWALVFAGVFRSLDFLDAWSGPAWPIYDLIFGAADRLVGAWALLRYPNSSLLRYQRIYLTLLIGWMFTGRLLTAVTSIPQWAGAPASSWWPTLVPDLRFNDVVNYVLNAGDALFGVALLVLLVMRLVRTTGLDRIVITPIIVAGLAAVVAAGASAVVQMLSALDGTPNGVYTVESAVDMALPLAFFVSVVQRALLLRNITTLTAQISGGADLSAVRYALRSTLHDPTLEILDLSAPDPGPPVPSGEAVGRGAADHDMSLLAEPSADRLVEFIRTEGGSPIAVVIADPALGRYRGLFDAAVQTSGLALKNAQFQAQAAREKLEQVRASRMRILEAGLAERRRIERDLHDGVQQHLLGLAAQLTVAISQATDEVSHEALTQVRDGLREVLAELRDLAHGIHPAVLSHGGLAAALEDVAERLPLPVRVSVPATRVATAVEATAYFVACEALANVVKHAHAGSATVSVRIEEAKLNLEVADDGVGGVAARGHGLSNILDRVSALDGEVTIVSPPGTGTRLEVRIPCG
jgi:signal transduction histidine kinase